MSRSLLLSLLLLPSLVVAQIPCDSEYGEHCPEHSPNTVGGCLSALGKSSISQPCADYVNIMNECAADIDKFCKDLSYTGEAMSCLTSWTKLEDLSDSCQAALPAVEAAKPREKSDKEERKAANRRRKREKAAKLAADQHPQKNQKKKKKRDIKVERREL